MPEKLTEKRAQAVMDELREELARFAAIRPTIETATVSPLQAAAIGALDLVRGDQVVRVANITLRFRGAVLTGRAAKVAHMRYGAGGGK